MDLHVYRNSHDRWYDLRSQARERGAVLAVNAFTLAEVIVKLTPDIRVATAGQQLTVVSRIAGGSPRYALEAISDIQAADSRTRNLLDGLVDSYRSALRQNGLTDPQERCWLAAARAAEKTSPWLRRFERVVLHAIYDLTEAEFALVRNIIEALPGGGTIVLFNTTANVKPTQFAEYTWQRFVRDEALAESTFPEFCRPSSPNGPLLERLFDFGTAREPLERLDSLRIVQSPGRYREIEFIGSQVVDLLKRGRSANEIAVVVRHIETYGEMIGDVFTRYRIPHAFETGIPLLRIPFIKYWFALLDLATSDRSRAALARVMSSAYFEPRLSPDIDVERELAAFGYIDRSHLPASDLARRKHSPLATDVQRLETQLDTFESGTNSISGFLAELRPPVGLTERDQEAWRSLTDELESVDVLAGSVSFVEFRAIALEIAAQRTVARISRQPAASGAARVRVMSPRALGTREFGWIFAPGIADGEFPSRTVSNPLLPEETIERINAAIRPRRLLAPRDRNRLEPLYLFMMLDSARERVTLTFPAATLEVEPMTPSIYIGELTRHFASNPVETLPHELPPVETGECLRRIASEWRAHSIDDIGAAELLGESIVRRVAIDKNVTVRTHITQGVVKSEHAWHPSELNALAACPFVFLARYRLNLRAAELPDFEIPPMEIGKLAHDILREFYATPVPSSEEAAAIRMDDIVRRRLADADIHGQGAFSVFDPSLWKIRRGQLVAALKQYVRFAVKDAFDGFETLTEYLDSRLPPAALGSIVLGGRPDHVAVRRLGSRVEGIRVDDFKYSAATSATTKLLKDSFQVPVYAWLAGRAVNADASTQVEGRYLLLRSPSTPVVSHAIDPAVFDELRERIEALVKKASDGKLHPDPADRQDCQTCDYRRLCRIAM